MIITSSGHRADRHLSSSFRNWAYHHTRPAVHRRRLVRRRREVIKVSLMKLHDLRQFSKMYHLLQRF